ncbi:hypothetical protein [Novosphingobium olei]|uniref:hypothetical protein n=1 Tax=Novosphingobium olei TaxID=2728851 RepID=UPI0030900EF9|nr:hypothetical protein NSDW_01580 [Novosphingobium olei]
MLSALSGHAGLIIGIVGFAVTIYQIRAVKTATEAAQAAIHDLKIRIRHYDIIQDCTNAESFLKELKVSLDANNMRDCIRFLDDIATALINVSERWDDLENDRLIVEDCIGRVQMLSHACAKNQGIESTPKTLDSIRDIHRTLVKIRMKIQKEQ